MVESVACSRLHWKLYRLCRKGKHCDVVVRALHKRFKCHRVVLASGSGFFDWLFSSSSSNDDYEEAGTKEVTLSQIDPVSFKSILRYIYCSRLPTVNALNVHPLLRASEFLVVNGVRDRCVEFLRKNVNAPLICHFESLTVARDANMDSYARWQSEFILNHFDSVLRTDSSFLLTPVDHLKALLIQYRYGWIPFENENFLLVALIRWCRSYNYAAREAHFAELIETVDFERVSIECVQFLRDEYKIDWEVDESAAAAPNGMSWRERLKKALVDNLKRIEHASGRYEEAPLMPYRDPPHRTCEVAPSATTPRLLVRRRVDLNKNSCHAVERAYEVYEVFSKVQYTWPSSHTFMKTVYKYHKGMPALIASAALDEPECLLYCLEYDSDKHCWPRFSVFASLDLCSDARQVLARAPFKFCHRPSLSGLGNRSDIIYLCGNDEDVKKTHWELAHFLCPELNDQSAYRQCRFYYKRDADKWFSLPVRNNELHSSCLATSDRLAYLIGGRVTYAGISAITNIVQAYEHRLSTWLTMPSTVHYYDSLASDGCVLNGEIFVCDGANMEIFSPAAGRWRRRAVGDEHAATMADRRCSWRKLIAYQNKVYFFELKRPNVTCRVYDPAYETWSSSTLHTNVIRGSYVNDILIL